jgi:hypothetical protein
MASIDDKAKNYEPERYQYAAAAAQFLQQKDITSTRKSLDKLLVDMGATDEDVKAGMVWNAYSDDPRKMIEGTSVGVKIYSGKYQDALGKKTMKEMFKRYSAEFGKYLGEAEIEKAKSAFDKLGDKTYEFVLEQVAELQETIQSKTKKYSKEEKEKAQKELEEKYADLFETIQEFEELRIAKLMAPIREATIKDNVKERYEVKEEKKEDGKGK